MVQKETRERIQRMHRTWLHQDFEPGGEMMRPIRGALEPRHQADVSTIYQERNVAGLEGSVKWLVWGLYCQETLRLSTEIPRHWRRAEEFTTRNSGHKWPLKPRTQIRGGREDQRVNEYGGWAMRSPGVGGMDRGAGVSKRRPAKNSGTRLGSPGEPGVRSCG